MEVLANSLKTVIPAKDKVQKDLKNLNLGLSRNDTKSLRRTMIRGIFTRASMDRPSL